MTRQQLKQTLKQQPTDGLRRPIRMRGSDLGGFDFSHQDLTGADFSFSNLTGANFQNTILCNANLSFSSLTDASFENADMTGAKLNFSGMDGANLTGANLTGVSMSFTGGGRNTPLPVLPPEPITLTNLLKKPVWGVLIGCLLGSSLVYGTSSVIYFTHLVLTAEDRLLAELNRFFAWRNLTEGVSVFLITYLLSSWLDLKIRQIWLRHVILSLALIPIAIRP